MLLASNAYGAVFDFNCNRFWHKQKKRMCESMIKNCWNRGAISGVFLNIRSFSGDFFKPLKEHTAMVHSLFVCRSMGKGGWWSAAIDASEHLGAAGNYSFEQFPAENAPRSWNPMNISKTLTRFTFETVFRVFYMIQKCRRFGLKKITFLVDCEIFLERKIKVT